MSAAELLFDLQDRGVQIWPDSGKIKYQAPQGVMTPKVKQQLAAHKSEVLSFLQTDLHGIPLAELQEIAGPDWNEVKNDPKELNSFAHMVSARHMRERGDKPFDYTATTECEHCGPVYVYPGFPEKAASCPWCWNRLSGKPIPRPEPVNCGACRNYIPDSVNPPGGMGRCRVRAMQARERPFFPWSKRTCDLWLPINKKY